MPDTRMPPRVDDPGYWHFRAENARNLANEMKNDDGARTIVLNIAEQYEHLARMAEERRRQPPHP